jgi:hypothetical protein
MILGNGPTYKIGGYTAVVDLDRGESFVPISRPWDAKERLQVSINEW